MSPRLSRLTSRAILPVLLMAMLLTGSARSTFAGADTIELPIIPDGDTCVLTPVDTDAIQAELEERAVDGFVELPTSPEIPEEGDAPDDEVLEAVTAFLVNLAACTNAGQDDAIFALLSVDAILLLIADFNSGAPTEGTPTPLAVEDVMGFIEFLQFDVEDATPEPIDPESAAGLGSIEEAIQLEDRRVYVEFIATTGTGDDQTEETAIVILVEGEDGYLFDYIGNPDADDDATPEA